MNSNAQASPVEQLLYPIKGKLMLVTALAGVGAMLSLVPLAGIAYIVEIWVEEGRFGPVDTDVKSQSLFDASHVWFVVGLSLGSLFLGLMCVSISGALAHLADNQITRKLRISIMQHLTLVPLGWFTSRASGDVKQAVQDDVNALHELTAHYYTTKGRCIGVISLSVVYLVVMDWRLAIVSLLPFPCFYLIFGAAKKSISEERMNAFVSGQALMNNAVAEFIGGLPVIKSFAMNDTSYSGYQNAVDSFLKGFLSFTRPLITPLANANAIIAPVAVLSVILLFGCLFISLDLVQPIDLLPFLLVAPGISSPLMQWNYSSHNLNHATAAAQRLQALLDTPVLAQPSPENRCQIESETVYFDNVSYAYAGDHFVLKNIELTLNAGSVTAIVGASGSGKSTLARLLLRFFDPTEGRITFAGVDLKDITVSDLYQHVGFVLQEPHLIHGSLHDNIALGRANASRTEVEQAAKAANIHDRIISLPQGYDSIIGQDIELSGGERQRINIARAILLDPPMIILDEPTASTDSENEVAIQTALSHLLQDRTVLVITHKLDTIEKADQIIVLDHGVVREQGTHQELLAMNGYYAKLLRLGNYHVDMRGK